MSTYTNASIPAPVKDDATYFQILIDNQLTSLAADKVNLTFTANKMSRTSPDILGVTWLSGGGTNYNDWTKPQMNVINAKSDVSGGPDFLSTYNVTLDQLPKDSTGKYGILKIPFLDPNDSTKSLAGSGHLTITVNTPAVMQINEDKSNSTFSLALPSPISDGAGGQNKWDFVELNCATPASNSKSVCFCNTTNVDFFALGVTIKGRSADGSTSTFGIDLNNSKPVTTLLSNLEALSSEYTAGRVNDSKGNYLRYLAPDLSFLANNSVLDTAITDGFNHYKTNDLSFKIGATQYTAKTNSANELEFTAPKAFTIKKPSSLDVIASTGPLDTGSTSDADIQGAMKFIDAALNRGIFTDTSSWATTSNWYPAGTEFNDYSNCLHNAFIDSACYAFSYDDVPGAPLVTSAPAIGACTSMSLTLSDD